MLRYLSGHPEFTRIDITGSVDTQIRIGSVAADIHVTGTVDKYRQ